MTAAMALASPDGVPEVAGVPGVAGKVGVLGKLVMNSTLGVLLGVRAGVELPELVKGDCDMVMFSMVTLGFGGNWFWIWWKS